MYTTPILQLGCIYVFGIIFAAVFDVAAPFKFHLIEATNDTLNSTNACYHLHVQIQKLLLKESLDASQTNLLNELSLLRSPEEVLIRTIDEDEFGIFLELLPHVYIENLNMRVGTYGGETLLTYSLQKPAAEASFLYFVNLVRAGANIVMTNDREESPLMIALATLNTGVTDLILDLLLEDLSKDALQQASKTNDSGKSALLIAIETKQFAVAKLLVNIGFVIAERCTPSLLEASLIHGNLFMIEHIMMSESKPADAMNLIPVAIEANQPGALRALLQYTDKESQFDIHNFLSKIFSVMHYETDLILELVSIAAKSHLDLLCSFQGANGDNLLHHAIKLKQVEVTLFLLDVLTQPIQTECNETYIPFRNSCDLNIPDISGQVPIESIGLLWDLDSVYTEAALDILFQNRNNEDGGGVLHQALSRNMNGVRLFVETCPKIVEAYDPTILHLDIENGIGLDVLGTSILLQASNPIIRLISGWLEEGSTMNKRYGFSIVSALARSAETWMVNDSTRIPVGGLTRAVPIIASVAPKACYDYLTTRPLLTPSGEMAYRMILNAYPHAFPSNVNSPLTHTIFWLLHGLSDISNSNLVINMLNNNEYSSEQLTEALTVAGESSSLQSLGFVEKKKMIILGLLASPKINIQRNVSRPAFLVFIIFFSMYLLSLLSMSLVYRFGDLELFEQLTEIIPETSNSLFGAFLQGLRRSFLIPKIPRISRRKDFIKLMIFSGGIIRHAGFLFFIMKRVPKRINFKTMCDSYSQSHLIRMSIFVVLIYSILSITFDSYKLKWLRFFIYGVETCPDSRVSKINSIKKSFFWLTGSERFKLISENKKKFNTYLSIDQNGIPNYLKACNKNSILRNLGFENECATHFPYQASTSNIKFDHQINPLPAQENSFFLQKKKLFFLLKKKKKIFKKKKFLLKKKKLKKFLRKEFYQKTKLKKSNWVIGLDEESRQIEKIILNSKPIPPYLFLSILWTLSFILASIPTWRSFHYFRFLNFQIFMSSKKYQKYSSTVMRISPIVEELLNLLVFWNLASQILIPIFLALQICSSFISASNILVQLCPFTTNNPGDLFMIDSQNNEKQSALPSSKLYLKTTLDIRQTIFKQFSIVWRCLEPVLNIQTVFVISGLLLSLLSLEAGGLFLQFHKTKYFRIGIGTIVSILIIELFIIVGTRGNIIASQGWSRIKQIDFRQEPCIIESELKIFQAMEFFEEFEFRINLCGINLSLNTLFMSLLFFVTFLTFVLIS